MSLSFCLIIRTKFYYIENQFLYNSRHLERKNVSFLINIAEAGRVYPHIPFIFRRWINIFNGVRVIVLRVGSRTRLPFVSLFAPVNMFQGRPDSPYRQHHANHPIEHRRNVKRICITFILRIPLNKYYEIILEILFNMKILKLENYRKCFSKFCFDISILYKSINTMERKQTNILGIRQTLLFQVMLAL